MKKVLLFFSFTFLSFLCMAQTSDVATAKLSAFADENLTIKELPAILSEYSRNGNTYFSSITLNPTIVEAVVENGVTENEEVHYHLRTYFSSTDPARRAESETYLLENL